MPYATDKEVRDLLDSIEKTRADLSGQANGYRSDAVTFGNDVRNKLIAANGAGLGLSVSLFSASNMPTFWLKIGGVLFWCGFFVSVALWLLDAGSSWLAVRGLDRTIKHLDSAASNVRGALDGVMSDQGEAGARASASAARPLAAMNRLIRIARFLWLPSCLLCLAGATALLVAGLNAT